MMPAKAAIRSPTNVESLVSPGSRFSTLKVATSRCDGPALSSVLSADRPPAVLVSGARTSSSKLPKS
jgi:hypothetical protein